MVITLNKIVGVIMNGNRQEVINAIINGMKSEAIESIKGWDEHRDSTFEAHNLWSHSIKNNWTFESDLVEVGSKRHLKPKTALLKVLSNCDDECIDICFADGSFESFFDAELVIDKMKSWDADTLEFKQ